MEGLHELVLEMVRLEVCLVCVCGVRVYADLHTHWMCVCEFVYIQWCYMLCKYSGWLPHGWYMYTHFTQSLAHVHYVNQY